MRYQSLTRLFQFSQKVGLVSSGVEGLGQGRACRSWSPARYTGAQVQSRLEHPPSSSRICATVMIPFLIREGEKYAFLCVSLSHAECHSGMAGIISSGGAATGAGAMKRPCKMFPKRGKFSMGWAPTATRAGAVHPIGFQRFASTVPYIAWTGLALSVVLSEQDKWR